MMLHGLRLTLAKAVVLGVGVPVLLLVAFGAAGVLALLGDGE